MARKRLRNRRISETTKLDYSNDISHLPDPILQHMLFFLPILDAARMSTLSTTWRRVWNSLPIFNFYLDQSPKNRPQYHMGIPEFIALVNKSLSPLQYQKAKIESFTLNMKLSQEGLASDVDNWICLVLGNYVRELSISFENLRYRLPQAMFVAKSLVKLTLKGCKFPSNLVIDATASSCLEELSLVNVVADDDQVQNLINCFRPSLQKLTFMMHMMARCLILDNFSKLQKVIAGVEILKVNAPNLQSLILGGTHKLLASKNTVNVKVLWCVFGPSPILNANVLKRLISKFPFLKTLYLTVSKNRRYRIQHHHLTTLHLYGTSEDPLEVEIDVPKLSQFYCDGNVFPSLRVMGTSIKECETLELLIHNPYSGILDGSRIHQLGNCLRNFNPSIEVCLLNICTENFLTLAQLEEQGVISYRSNVRKLVLNQVSASSDYTSFLDGLFWTCQPSSLMVIECSVDGVNFVKFLCRELLGRQINPSCCGGNQFKCWRHFLKSVEVRYFTNSCESEESVSFRGHDLSEILIVCDTVKEVEFIFDWLEDPVCSSFQDFYL